MADADAHTETMLVAVPLLHPVKAGAVSGVLALPGVRYIDPGIMWQQGAGADVARLLRPGNLPFTGTAARACLHELTQLIDRVGVPRDLAMLALHDEQAAAAAVDSLREMASLKAFMASGGVHSQTAKAVLPKRDMLVEAQKTLLLAYRLEESAGQIAGLQAQYESALVTMKEVLGVEGSDDLCGMANIDAPTAFFGGVDMAVLSWRVVLDNMVPFVEEKAVFVTEHAAMSSDLALLPEACPLTPEKAVDICSAWDEKTMRTLNARPMYVYAPLWHLLGQDAPTSDRIWQQRSFGVVFSAP